MVDVVINPIELLPTPAKILLFAGCVVVTLIAALIDRGD